MKTNEPIIETTPDPSVVNGRRYSLWPKLVESKADFIGGTLEEYDRDVGEVSKTKIVDIKFGPNGAESAMFTVCGEDFDESCDVGYLSVGADDSMFPEKTGSSITFSTQFGTTFRLTKPTA